MKLGARALSVSLAHRRVSTVTIVVLLLEEEGIVVANDDFRVLRALRQQLRLLLMGCCSCVALFAFLELLEDLDA